MRNSNQNSGAFPAWVILFAVLFGLICAFTDCDVPRIGVPVRVVE